MKKYYSLLFMLLFAVITRAQYADPNFPVPASGYGSDGPHTVDVITIPNTNFPGHPIKIYHPGDIITAVPTIFYSHAFGGTDPDNIIGVLNFIAKKGYAVVFVPYPTTDEVTVEERYAQLIAGFRKAVQLHGDILNTAKVGFLGHSFGGGASFGIAHECFETDGWGTQGKFIYALAQWYSYNITPEQLDSFPEDAKVLIEVFDDDETNDHRMAMDIFNHINIDPAGKDFLLVNSSTVNGYNYQAVHNLPNITAAFDALDYYAYYRLLDALCDYTFNGTTAGKSVALGNGGTAQVTMPEGMGDLVEFENPSPQYEQDGYEFPCSSDQNSRAEFCPEILSTLTPQQQVFTVYPNPAESEIVVEISTASSLDIAIFNSLGQLTGQYTSAQNRTKIDISYLQQGVYYLFINGVKEKCIKL